VALRIFTPGLLIPSRCEYAHAVPRLDDNNPKRAAAATEVTAGAFVFQRVAHVVPRFSQAPEYFNLSPAPAAPSWFLVRWLASLLLRACGVERASAILKPEEFGAQPVFVFLLCCLGHIALILLIEMRLLELINLRH
jgi:hypothetical protein